MVEQEEVCNFPLASLSLILSLLWSLGRKKSQELLEAIIHFRAIDFCFTAAADFEALKVLLRSSCQGCHQYLNDYLRGNLKLKDQSLQIRQRQTRFLLLKILLYTADFIKIIFQLFSLKINPKFILVVPMLISKDKFACPTFNKFRGLRQVLINTVQPERKINWASSDSILRNVNS